ncbi:hypothetical protein Vadar_023561 [Vaccinium darrowii]|uniref:Uncharacterized protein n=1 Tax=Vaccinium darrowii TaxID=229202 RepID=A0ACB7YFN5_9ERIC|nr:hypothetical protein Vadar_023561 [Vaccinium darrowii]
MEATLEEKNNDVDSDDYPQELKDGCIAAFTLIGMKYVKMDFQLANHQNRQNRETLGEYLPLLPVDKAFIEALSLPEGLLLKLKVPERGKPIDGLTPPEFPPIKNLQGQIGECGMPFEKQLTTSDVKEDQSGLTITKDLVTEFIDPMMTDEEKDASKKVEGIQVLIYDSRGNQYQMKFKRWSGGKSQVLTSGWKAFCKDNEFKAHEDWITIWVSRHKETQKLCFVILARRFPITKLVPRKYGNKGENASHISENNKRKQIEFPDDY